MISGLLKWGLFFLLCWLAVCPLLAQTESDIPPQLTREDDNTELQPPFDPGYDSTLFYVPDLGVLITRDTDDKYIITPEQAPVPELQDTQARDTVSYLLPGVGYSKGENIHLTLDGLVNMPGIPLSVYSFCSLPDPFFADTDNEEKLFQYYLKGVGSGESGMSVWDFRLQTGCTVLPAERNLLLLALNGNWSAFPGNMNWESGTRLWFLISKDSGVVYQPVFIRETAAIKSITDEALPVFSGDLLLAYEPAGNILEWSTRVALKKSLSAAEPAVQITAGAALSAGNDFFMLLPEIQIRYFAAESLSLVFDLHSCLEGDGASEADKMQDTLLNQPLADNHFSFDRGVINSLALQYSSGNFFDVNTSFVFYTGTWNISREGLIYHELITDLDLALALHFYFSPAPLDIDIGLTLLQGLLFNIDRHSISWETIFRFHNFPLELSLSLDWLTAPSVILPEIRYSESGGSSGIKTKLILNNLITIEAGGKIIFDKNIKFLDYNASFSIFYYIE